MKGKILIHLTFIEILYAIEVLLFSYISKPSFIESLSYIRYKNPLTAMMHIWLNNAASALVLSSLSSVHPLIAYLGMIPVAASEGHVLSSWLAGHVPYAHLIYSFSEDQAYITSSLLGIAFFLKLRRAGDIIERWSLFKRNSLRIAVLITAVFLLLSAIEVWEVWEFT